MLYSEIDLHKRSLVIHGAAGGRSEAQPGSRSASMTAEANAT
jgi:hypothetical protein